MALTIDQIRRVSLPINIWRNNNLSLSNVSPYNNAVNLYNAIVTVVEEIGGDGVTDLGASQGLTSTSLTSSSGDGVEILGANDTRSGVMTADHYNTLTALVTLSGVADQDEDLGDFTGTTIPSSVTIKAALQALETALEEASIEGAQDAVGTILANTPTIHLFYDDGTPTITATLQDDSVTFAKMQNISTGKLLGRSTAGTGNTEEISVGSGLTLSGGTLSASGGSGTVTSVAATVPGIFTIAGSPVTTTGTLAISLASQSTNTVFAGPDSGSPTTPAFRALVSDDIPSLAASKISDFSEAVDDRVNALLVEGTGITLTYDDGSNTLTIEAPASGYTTENAQDDIGTILVDSSTIDFTYNDGTPSITAGVKSNSISNTNLTSGTGGIYKGSGTIASGAAAKLTAASTFRINYSDDNPGITIDDVDLSTTTYSNSGDNYVYVNDATVEIASVGGLLLPLLTEAERDALTPEAGIVIYNITTNKLNFYNSST